MPFKSVIRIAVLLVALFPTVSTVSAGSARPFVRGDVLVDGLINLTDPIAVLEYLFLGGSEPDCRKSADANDDGAIQLADAVFLLNYLFTGSAVIPPPFPDPGIDPTPDDLSCGASELTDLAVSPSSLTIAAIGATAQLEVVGIVGADEIDTHEAASGTTYASSNRHVAGVYRDGLVEARTPGRTTILVKHGALERVVDVVVSDAPTSSSTVLASSELGMNLTDRDFSVFSLRPPLGVLRAQVVRREANGSVRLLGADEVELRYSSIPDSNGAENSSSADKCGFWENAAALLDVELERGEGLLGLSMPNDAPTPGPQGFNRADPGRFVAAGIPITPWNDSGDDDPFPLLRVLAFARASGEPVGHVDVVVPVSDDVDCRGCHATGEVAAQAGFVRWSRDENVESQARENILSIHDFRSRTRLASSRPVLCARCHYTAALDLAGNGPNQEQAAHKTLSQAMHVFHGSQLDADGDPLFPSDGPPEETCLRCHPGPDTHSTRGAMHAAGLRCRDCHGDMLAVSGLRPLLPGGSVDGRNDGNSRRPWRDLPRCQSCHTGDNVSRLSGPDYVASPDGIRLRQAFRIDDASASSNVATNRRFAENEGALFRFSTGHGGLLCSGCHGSPHAEWPNADSTHNDNVASNELQGHAGVVVECIACHAPGSIPRRSLDGPHGMHSVADIRWIKGHGDPFEHHASECQACHGVDLEGSVLSRAAADRDLRIEDDLRVRIPKGTAIGCDLCHRKPVPGEDDDEDEN